MGSVRGACVGARVCARACARARECVRARAYALLCVYVRKVNAIFGNVEDVLVVNEQVRGTNNRHKVYE